MILGVFWGEIRKAPLSWLPLPFLVLSLAEYQGSLWAFQFAWLLILLAVVSGVALPEAARRVLVPVLGGFATARRGRV